MNQLSRPCRCIEALINTVCFSTEWNILIKTCFLLYKLSIMLGLLHAIVKQHIWPLKFCQTDNAEAPSTVSTSDVQKGRAPSMCHISQRTKESCNFPITLRLPLQSSQYTRQKQSITEKQDSYEMAKRPPPSLSLSLCSYCPLPERTDSVRDTRGGEKNWPTVLFAHNILKY